MKNTKELFCVRRRNKTADVFEELRSAVACSYISDLKTEPYITKARQALRGLDLEAYPPRQVSDLRDYLGL